MRVAAVLLLFLATSSICYAVEKPKATKLQTLERVAVYASAQFDAVTTYRAIKNCPPGSVCTESNPMMRPLAGNPAIFPVMAGSAWAVDYLSRKISPDHPKLGRAIRWISIGGHMAAGISNLR